MSDKTLDTLRGRHPSFRVRLRAACVCNFRMRRVERSCITRRNYSNQSRNTLND